MNDASNTNAINVYSIIAPVALYPESFFNFSACMALAAFLPLLKSLLVSFNMLTADAARIHFG